MLALLLMLTAGAEEPIPETATIVSVYDGDTFTLDSGDKVRLSGVNTPELKPKEAYGIEARDFASKLVLNKQVKLIVDPDNARDGYGRLIAGVQVGDTDLSEELLKEGLAHLFIIPPDNRNNVPELLAAQKSARDAKKGIWSTDRYAGALHITSFKANPPGDERRNPNDEYLRVCNVLTEPVNLAGYAITDDDGHRWELPAVTIPPGHTFKIHSGRGEPQADPSEQLRVYLNSLEPVWNNTEDRATLYDKYGKVLDTRLHKPQSR